MPDSLETVKCPFNHPDCAARFDNLCIALSEMDFGGKDCPFYKSKSQNSAEQKTSAFRLCQLGKTNLIHKYHG